MNNFIKNMSEYLHGSKNYCTFAPESTLEGSVSS